MPVPQFEDKVQASSWVLNLKNYNRATSLSEKEQIGLSAVVGELKNEQPWPDCIERSNLKKLLQPLSDAFQKTGTQLRVQRTITNVLLRKMVNDQQSYWAWDDED